MVLTMIVATKGIVATALAAIIVSPRLPDDRPFRLGGRLTNRFRLLVVILLLLHLARSIVVEFAKSFIGTQFVLGVLEMVGASFGVLYMPYLLQVWLSTRINVGRPGDNLKTWWLAITSISIVAGVLSDTVSYHFWALKKVANVISVYPVWKTLQVYNSVTMLGGPYPGRGTVLSQLVSHCEIFVLVINLADVCQQLVLASGYTKEDNENQDSLVMFLLAIKHSSGFAAWVRILCHSILLNVLDEQRFISKHTPPAGGGGDGEDVPQNEEDIGTSSLALLPLINRSHARPF